MREELAQLEAKLLKSQVQRETDLRRMKDAFAEEKEMLRLEMIEMILEPQQKAAEELILQHQKRKEEAAVAMDETKRLKMEMSKLLDEIEPLRKANEDLENTNKEIESMMTSLNQFVMKKTKEHTKLEATKEKLETVYRGAAGLLVEPGIKKLYRSYMYKCANRIHLSNAFDALLYDEVMDAIRSCESELGAEVLVENEYQDEKKAAFDEAEFFKTQCEAIAEQDSPEISDDMDVDHFTRDAENQSNALSNLGVVANNEQISTLYENKEMLISIFKFLDVDGSGSIDKEEFRVGLDLLNRRLPATARFKDHEKLFRALDVDRSGELDLDEFNLIFSLNAETSEYHWGDDED